MLLKNSCISVHFLKLLKTETVIFFLQIASQKSSTIFAGENITIAYMETGYKAVHVCLCVWYDRRALGRR